MINKLDDQTYVEEELQVVATICNRFLQLWKNSTGNLTGRVWQIRTNAYQTMEQQQAIYRVRKQ